MQDTKKYQPGYNTAKINRVKAIHVDINAADSDDAADRINIMDDENQNLRKPGNQSQISSHSKKNRRS